ncbi:MAG TPA: hypothetical protein VGA69_05970 [Nitriliruptorales bacterium]
MTGLRTNVYARRHGRRLARAIDPGESLLAASRVTFFGSADVARSRRMPGEPAFLARKAAYRRWLAGLGSTAFPPAGPDFVLGVTEERWIVWRTTKWWNLPAEVAGDIAHDAIAGVDVQRVLISGVLTIRFRDGGQVLVEAPVVRRLRPLAAAHGHATTT